MSRPERRAGRSDALRLRRRSARVPAGDPALRRPARRRRRLPDRRRATGDAAPLAALDVRALARRGARRGRDRRGGQPRLRRRVRSGGLRDLDWHYLQDETIEIGGVSFFGSPWTSRFQDWAFMLTEDELAERWSLIPPAIDVLCVHSPPLGYGDWISGHSIGSPSLLAAIDERAPKLCVVRPRAPGLRALAARSLRARQRGLLRHGLPARARAGRRRPRL